MLNYLWSGMILIGILFAAFSGKMSDITIAALDSSKEAVKIIRQKNQLQQTSLQMYSDLAGRQLRQVLKQWKSFRSWKKTAALEKQQDR